MGTNVSLTPELEKFAKSKVEEGLYSSVSEVMREALRRMKIHDIEYAKWVRGELEKAETDIAVGRVEDFDFDAIIAEAEEELRLE